MKGKKTVRENGYDDVIKVNVYSLYDFVTETNVYYSVSTLLRLKKAAKVSIFTRSSSNIFICTVYIYIYIFVDSFELKSVLV